jgi:EAL domain-containing protein (putative c-di-GMP-specific phosphodiesterase class I)
MEDLTNIEDVSLLAQKIQEVIIQPIHVDGHTLYTSCSIGLSLYPQDDTDANNLIKYADAAMYKAKEEGRNNFQFYASEMTEFALERMVMKSSLRDAIDNEEFILYYQPQVDATGGKLTGLEALIRWQHPKMGLLHPQKFISLAKESGLIVEIDRWVMNTAMKQFRQWYDEGLESGVLALNLSMRQLRSDDFINILQESMKAADFKPEWLELEVTEGEVMQKPEESIMKLEEISRMGINITIDDFGTGYSSLAYLKRLPVSKLKIDQSFVQGLPNDQDDVAIVKAIIALAESLGLDLVAEGVEREAQKEFLLASGCKQIQGYYYGEAVSAEEIKKNCLE